ncbi:unnamed protein product, partial [Ixodes persulcatus]
ASCLPRPRLGHQRLRWLPPQRLRLRPRSRLLRSYWIRLRPRRQVLCDRLPRCSSRQGRHLPRCSSRCCIPRSSRDRQLHPHRVQLPHHSNRGHLRHRSRRRQGGRLPRCSSRGHRRPRSGLWLRLRPRSLRLW